MRIAVLLCLLMVGCAKPKPKETPVPPGCEPHGGHWVQVIENGQIRWKLVGAVFPCLVVQK